MPLDWKTISYNHVLEACDLVAKGEYPPRSPAKGIFVIRNGDRLPAKQILRVAYCLANNLPLSTYIDFASGEAHVNLLRRLGFQVEHQGSPGEPKQA